MELLPYKKDSFITDDKFVQIAKNYYDLLNSAIGLRDDLNIVVTSHMENMGDMMNPQWKMKTVGRMLDNLITIDGLFTYLLYSELKENEDTGEYEYVYRTRTLNGTDTCKTPMGCFDKTYIPNDLKYVIDTIEKYNNDEV